MNTITVEKSETTKFEVRFIISGTKEDFNEMLNDFKKSTFPRQWIPDKKAWHVPQICEVNLKKWCLESQWDSVIWLGEELKGKSTSSGWSSGKTKDDTTDKNQKKTSQDKKSPGFEDFVDFETSGNGSKKLYATLYLTPDAPQELVEFVWKRLMVMYHPDKNSNPQAGDKTATINAAYQEIKKLKGEKDEYKKTGFGGTG